VPLGTGFFLLLRDGAKLRKGADQLELLKAEATGAPTRLGCAVSGKR
jgi:hypothetical protein